MDFFPVILLFAISVTGLALTVSQEWLRGAAYSFLAIIHAITVIAGLLFLPFGKFFHIFQRPAQLGVKLYQMTGEHGPGAICPRCKQRFASAMHVRDLKTVLPQLGFDYSLPGTEFAWQDLCPPCKRKTLSLSQLKLKSAAREDPSWLNFLERTEQLRDQYRTASQLRAGRRLEQRVADHAGPAGQNALLFLRTAVRHSAQGPRQSRHRVRAVGRLSVQSGNALPEGRQALFAIESSGSSARSAAAHGRAAS